MPAFTPAPATPSGAFNSVPSITPGSFVGNAHVGYLGTYGEVGITYGEPSHLFNGIHGVWRYGGFLAAFTGHDPDTTGAFVPAPDTPSGVFNPS